LKHLDLVAELEALMCLEVSLSGPAWTDDLRRVAELIADCNDRLGKPAGCLKVRGSGPARMSRQQISEVVVAVADRGIPLKVTAGYHHPLIEYDRYANEHGFLSLAVALCLCRLLGGQALPASTVAECLAAQDILEFSFEDGVGWRNLAVRHEQ